MTKNPQGYLQLEIFSPFKDLIHGFSLKETGDMRQSLENFLAKFNLSLSDSVTMEQIHSEGLSLVTEKEKGQTIKGADGLLTKQKNIFLVSINADCLPILFYDPIQKRVAIDHVGWRGALTNLLPKTVSLFKDLSSNIDSLLVGFGPGIGPCCYNIDEIRARLFAKNFGSEAVTYKENQPYLNLFAVNKMVLMQAGIKEENIQAEVFCTNDHSDILFSYRADKGHLVGEFASIIGVKE